MNTILIQIGNTDDKLTQAQWSEFVEAMNKIIQSEAEEVHFHGCSNPVASWQNCAWVLIAANPELLQARITKCREKYQQESVAWMTGETEFI